MELNALIQRCEEATATNQHIVLEEAIKYADRRKWIDRETAFQALAWIEVGAFIDAALTLVPEGWWWIVNSGRETDLSRAMVGYAGYQYVADFAAGPALALCIAALRARDME